VSPDDSTHQIDFYPDQVSETMQATILLVDDEPHILELCQMYLAAEGFDIITARNGEEALAKVDRESPSLVVLDLMMPQMDGWEVCRRIRQRGDLPVIMLTARDDDVDKIVGLEIGADDYLTKPFNPRELVARVRAVLRRTMAQPTKAASNSLQIGSVVLDVDRHEVTVKGKPIQLRSKEFELLQCLMRNAGLVLSREKLLDLVWGYDYYGETRTVDVHVAHLRKELQGSDVQIETIWGVGYKLVGPDEE
jgi:two-component system alkaline phosphatase synthesis response regulator PhoP/two-component system response regulator ResD